MNKRGYKQTPLGWIPKDWEIKELGELGSIQRGKSKHRPRNAPFLFGGNYPFIQTGDIKEANLFVEKFSQTYNCDGLRQSKLWNENTLCITIAANIAETAILKISACFPDSIVGFIAFDGISSVLFVKYSFDLLKDSIQSTADGGAQDNLNLEKLQKIKFRLPPFHEQCRIATILSTWDTAIAKEQQLINTLQTRHNALAQQVLTGKIRLKGFRKEWKEVTYGSLLKEVKRHVVWNDNELYRLISVRRGSGGIFSREALLGHQIKVKDLRTANAGDFLFSKMQILHGASALVTKEFDGAKISGSYIAVVAKDPKRLNISFFNWYSQLPFFYHQTYISSFGVHIEKMTFDFEAFLSLAMAVPPLEEQTAIASILSTSAKEIQIHRRHLAALQQQKKGLMQVLLTGKVRVKTKEL
jgi:type I restriction enzyme S subunit